MGNVFAELTLKNSGDVTNVNRGIIKENEIRSLTVTALVDTGAITLVINEDMQRKLGLALRGEREATVANETKVMCKITDPVEVHWKNRFTAIPALVMPGGAGVLLGAIPLEDMDLIVDPARQALIGAHGDEIVSIVKRVTPKRALE